MPRTDDPLPHGDLRRLPTVSDRPPLTAPTGAPLVAAARGSSVDAFETTPVPAEADLFERAAAGQCVSGVRYCVAQDSDEAQFFTTIARGAIKAGVQLPSTPPQLLLAFEEYVDGGELLVVDARVGQLVRTPNPPIHGRAAPKNSADWHPSGAYDVYTAAVPIMIPGHATAWRERQFVQEPTEPYAHYEVATSYKTAVRHVAFVFVSAEGRLPDPHAEGAAFNLDAEGDVCEAPLNYAVKLTIAKRPKGAEYIYNTVTDKPCDDCVKLEVGEVDSNGNFSPWENGIYIKSDELKTRLLPSNWPKPGASASEDSLPDDEELRAQAMAGLAGSGAIESNKRYVFETVGHVTCVQSVNKDKSVVWKEVANFEMLELVCVYVSLDPADAPRYHVRVRQRVNENGHYTPRDMGAGQQVSNPEYAAVDVLIDLSVLERPTQVCTVFQKAHAKLFNHMTPDMLGYWISERVNAAPVKKVASFFGRQVHEHELWIFGNCAMRLKSDTYCAPGTDEEYDDTRVEFVAHSETGVVIVPSKFSQNPRWS